MLPRLMEPALLQIGRLIACDVTRVYRLHATRRRESPPAHPGPCDFAFIGPEQLETYSRQPELEIGTTHVALVRSGEARCYAALENRQLAAYAWFAEQVVAARHNTGGRHFTGLGLRLGSGMSYVFKCLVIPRYRGRDLMSRLLHQASIDLEAQGIDELVTTTDIGNRAFQRSVERIGFMHVDHAAEFVFCGQHLYRLPASDDRIAYSRGVA